MDAANPPLIRETFAVGPLQCNCTLLGDAVSRKALVIDPGGSAEVIAARLRELDLELLAIIHTHAHLDHFLASGRLKELTGASLYLHPDDRFLWDNLETQCRLFGIPYRPVPAPDHELHDDQELPCACGVTLHTPGHSPGSVSFWFPRQSLLIAGDTLFHHGIGRTDLWGGDQAAIERSIRHRLYVLDEDATVITGHGPPTRLGEEMRNNPFVRAAR